MILDLPPPSSWKPKLTAALRMRSRKRGVTPARPVISRETVAVLTSAARATSTSLGFCDRRFTFPWRFPDGPRTARPSGRICNSDLAASQFEALDSPSACSQHRVAAAFAILIHVPHTCLGPRRFGRRWDTGQPQVSQEPTGEIHGHHRLAHGTENISLVSTD